MSCMRVTRHCCRAHLKFTCSSAAARALEKWRFRLVIGDRPARMFFTVANKEGMGNVFGPAGGRFSVTVRVRDHEWLLFGPRA